MSLDLRPKIEAGQFPEYHFQIETLVKYGVECTQDSYGNLLVRYNYGENVYKLCWPQEKEKEKKWKYYNPNKLKITHLFGFSQLPANGDLVIITSGEKDVMTFDTFNLPAICLKSESSTLSPELIQSLKMRFKNVAICYDKDETGNKFSHRWSEKFGLARIELPEDLEGKDIYDFKSSGRTKAELDDLIKLAIKRLLENKTSFTGKEVMESRKNTEYIIPEILPKSNLVGLIGGSDTGKSLMLLQFSISYILNKPMLGLEIKGGKKVLICSFEDDTNSLKRRLEKLMNSLNSDERRKVCENIIFELDPDRIEEKIENHMEINPDTGIIIIDPLTEVLNGVDMNNASSVRQEMKFLNKISTKYGLTVIFINHISKSSEGTNRLNKSNSIGSQAIEAKCRVMFEMKKHINALGSSTVEIGIVKGNDIDEKYKGPGKSLFLKLATESFWFEKTDSFSPENFSTREIDWLMVYGENKKMKTQELNMKLNQEYELTEKQSEKLISTYLNAHRISRGLYRRPDLNEHEEVGRAS